MEYLDFFNAELCIWFPFIIYYQYSILNNHPEIFTNYIYLSEIRNLSSYTGQETIIMLPFFSSNKYAVKTLYTYE